MSSHVFEARSVSRHFDAVVALDGVSLGIRAGEVHAIIGENGAGKSTIAKVLAGMVPFDAGEISFERRDYRPSSPRDAAESGIGIVHQHFMLFPSLTVAENIVLGSEPGHPLKFDSDRAVQEVRDLSERYGMPFDPTRRLGDLSVGEQQRVEILKALRRDVELLILDEPTAVLTPQEVERLFKGIRRLIGEGYTVIVIAHKLEEVLEIADDITVLRRGRVVATRRCEDTTKQELVRLMVGDDLSPKGHTYGTAGAPVLTIDDITLGTQTGLRALDGINLTVNAGEIVGVAGVEGNGQFELEQVLGGLQPVSSGAIWLSGVDITHRSARTRANMGLAYIPGDRLVWGCAPTESVFNNAISRDYHAESRFGVLRKGALRQQLKEAFARFDVRTPGQWLPVSNLSGGNIQKLILGRELHGRPHKAIVVAMPTRGIDIRGVAFIHDLLRRYRDDGCAVLLISTDLDEIISLSDRIAILYDGAVVAVVEGGGKPTKEELGAYMLHGSTMQPAASGLGSPGAVPPGARA